MKQYILLYVIKSDDIKLFKNGDNKNDIYKINDKYLLINSNLYDEYYNNITDKIEKNIKKHFGQPIGIIINDDNQNHQNENIVDLFIKINNKLFEELSIACDKYIETPNTFNNKLLDCLTIKISLW